MKLISQIICAMCVCLTAVSKGAEFGFTSQLTYSFQHGYNKSIVTDVDISMMGKLTDNEVNAI